MLFCIIGKCCLCTSQMSSLLFKYVQRHLFLKSINKTNKTKYIEEKVYFLVKRSSFVTLNDLNEVILHFSEISKNLCS